MKLHLFWLDKGWKNRDSGCANHFHLNVDMDKKTFKAYTSPYYGADAPYDIEVKRKSDITDYIGYLKNNGFTEE